MPQLTIHRSFYFAGQADLGAGRAFGRSFPCAGPACCRHSVLGAGFALEVYEEEPLAVVDDGARIDSADPPNSVRPRRIATFQLWPTLTCSARIWIWEGVFIVFIASIETSEILFNQDRE